MNIVISDECNDERALSWHFKNIDSDDFNTILYSPLFYIWHHRSDWEREL